MKKFFLISATMGLLLVIVFAGCSDNEGSKANDSEEVVEWNLSMWGSSRAWTKSVDQWAEDMEEQTDGKWKINIEYGETLGPAEDQLEGLSNNLFEAAGVAPSYTPDKLVLQQILDLPYIAPSDTKDIIKLAQEIWEHPDVKENMEENNIVPLLPALQPQFEMMSTKKIETTDDLDGLKVSGMNESKGKLLEKFGAAPEPMSAPDVYNSLDRGTIDAVTFPYSFSFGSYKIQEVAKNLTLNFDLGGDISAFFANKQAWENLPDEFKKIHKEYVEDEFIDNTIENYKEADEKWEEEFEEEDVEIIEFPEEERKKMESEAEDVWTEWVEKNSDRGPTQEMLDYVLEKKEEIENE